MSFGAKLLAGPLGRIARSFPGARELDIEGQTSALRNSLGPYIERNNTLVRVLKRSESAKEGIRAVKQILFGELNEDGELESEDCLVGLYQKIGQYNDGDVVADAKRRIEQEISWMKKGTGGEREDGQVAAVPREAVQVLRDNFSDWVETMTVVGHLNASSVNDNFADVHEGWAANIPRDGDFGPLAQRVETFRRTLESSMEESRERQERWAKHLSETVLPALGEIKKKDHDIDRFYNNLNIRFKHTFLVIKEKIFKGGKEITFAEAHPGFQRGDADSPFGEVAPGLDHAGYPLEVVKRGGEYKVLTDIWWNEIAKNEWQRHTIAGIPGVSEGKPGGKEILQAKVGEERTVRPEFVREMDPLEKAICVLNEMDAYNVDLMYGAYHPHSKTIYDYLIAADGGFTRAPYRRSKQEVIPTEKIKLPTYTPSSPKKASGYVEATPKMFMEVPADERQVTRSYTMLTQDGEIKGTRRPTLFSPAFDRRALRAKGGGSTGGPFLHWGRMYYWEDSSGINRWSENPYPFISTKGVAMYIADRMTRRNAPALQQAIRETYNPEGYDWGVRMLGEPFPENLLAGFGGYAGTEANDNREGRRAA